MSSPSSSKTWQLSSRPSFHLPSKSKSTSHPNPNTNLLETKRSTTDVSPSTPSKSSRAWKKTKEFFNSLGEPPTATWEREQAKKKEVKTSGRDAFGAVNYGLYHQGGPFGGRT
ncbi:hypothetical protein NA56DRAFT_744094 [Hyaloscypha hepaticicola]|uniref:Uncharacterized protein n=1 Tax=Hyaloscypha hepaticicola TaxID=2082293 RepID=A0A2J6QKK8_9HELO|nr:hypothetical protein NA56DRAFT_744094 [Hyaloscypha hepaticicola]